MDTLTIIRQFNIKGEVNHTIPFGNGHINDSFKLTNIQQNCPDYFLQRVNHKIFDDVPQLMNNIFEVTEHLKAKAASGENAKATIRLLSIVTTNDKQLFFREIDGYWRVFEFMSGLNSYNQAQNLSQSYEAARAYGGFLRDLTDYDYKKLHISIPGFHDLTLRLAQLDEAINNLENLYRKSLVGEEIKQCLFLANNLLILNQIGQKGVVPIRVTHNDTKFNNVMFNEDDKAVCVIDLDTVMPGYVFYDLGDALRTGTALTEEDSADFESIGVNEELIESFISGYLSITRDILTKMEIRYLAKSAAFMALIMAVRFLTDHINGNVYYKTTYEGHNLIRARNQLRLTKEFLTLESEIKAIIGNA